MSANTVVNFKNDHHVHNSNSNVKLEERTFKKLGIIQLSDKCIKYPMLPDEGKYASNQNKTTEKTRNSQKLIFKEPAGIRAEMNCNFTFLRRNRYVCS